MNQDNTEIVKQLKAIKLWVALGAIGFLLIGSGVVSFSASMMELSSEFEKQYPDKDNKNDSSISWDRGTELFEQAKIDDLLKLTEERLKTHPNDGTAHWFKAKVHFMRKEWNLSLASLEQAEICLPNLKTEYTGPLRDKIKEMRQQGSIS
jgi:hypothetical protein